MIFHFDYYYEICQMQQESIPMRFAFLIGYIGGIGLLIIITSVVTFYVKINHRIGEFYII